MSPSPRILIHPCTLFALACLVASSWLGSPAQLSYSAEKEDAAKPQMKPVDDSMHHFMEYVFEPNYKRLKSSLASAPQDRNAWKAIKGDALTLAECANLLLARAPKDGAEQWRKLSSEVRTAGGELYQAARKSDYEATRKSYVGMLTKCNACHMKFADGKHQLEP